MPVPRRTKLQLPGLNAIGNKGQHTASEQDANTQGHPLTFFTVALIFNQKGQTRKQTDDDADKQDGNGNFEPHGDNTPG